MRAVFTPDAEWLAPAGNATALAMGGTHHFVGRGRIVRFLTAEFGAARRAAEAGDARAWRGQYPYRWSMAPGVFGLRPRVCWPLTSPPTLGRGPDGGGRLPAV